MKTLFSANPTENFFSVAKRWDTSQVQILSPAQYAGDCLVRGYPVSQNLADLPV